MKINSDNIQNEVFIVYGISYIDSEWCEIYRTHDLDKVEEVYLALQSLLTVENASKYLPPNEGYLMVYWYLLQLYNEFGIVNASGYDDFEWKEDYE